MNDNLGRLRKNQVMFSILYLLVMLGMLGLIQASVVQRPNQREVPYTELTALLEEGKVERAEVRDSEIVALLKPEGDAADARRTIVIAQRLPRIDDTTLVQQMEAQQVELTGLIEKPSWLGAILTGWLLPMALMIAVYVWLMRRFSQRSGPLTLGKNQAKIYDETAQGKVTFADVAGVDEAKAELVEIVDFLRSPEKYREIGARIPKGALLVGPPGTGKTLLARAVAGEAGVAFFSLSGSEFVEMFVGLGAARMRDLFEQAKLRAPCIVFIDELDAIGKSRGGRAAMATHDEREQTLNQLLVEMDGFDATKGVILVAATNRPEVLDPALLRAGRFDRQVLVDRPDVRGREAILRIHAREVKLDEDADLTRIARRTPGMVGADLANVVNEAALAAARRGAKQVAQEDFEEALDRIQLGLKKQGHMMSPDEKRRVAYHEAGHTLVAMTLPHADPVHRVTIIPRSIGALGATLQLPTEDRYLLTTDELRDRLSVMMGGRAAEVVAFGDFSTGAENDLARATETARRMVCRFGMSEKLGPVTLGNTLGAGFLGEVFEERSYSEQTARAVDSEVRTILEEAYDRAEQILSQRRAVLERLVEALLERETVEREEIEAILAEDAGPPEERRAAK